MTTREDINKFIESTTGGHRETLKDFCAKYPNWNPIRGRFEEDPIK